MYLRDFVLVLASCVVLIHCIEDYDDMSGARKDELAREMIKNAFVMEEDSTVLASITDSSGLAKNIAMYQRMHQLTVTSVFDQETLIESQRPRCGMKSMKDRSLDMRRRKKRFSTSNSRWNNASPLSYYFESYTPDLSQAENRKIVADAWKAWSDVTNLAFIEGTSSNKDINIIFGAGEHGDGASSAFDGRGGTLAHAYFPGRGIGGDAHFDEDELWTDRTSNGINLYQVAVHEFGHSLGLGHSTDRSAIMFPSYLGFVPDFKLGEDDINGIQSLYGRKSSQTTTTTTPRPTTTTTTRRPQITTTTTARVTTTTTSRPGASDRVAFCNSDKVDAIVTFMGITYLFRDDQYGVILDDTLETGYPRRISGTFAGLDGITTIDTAFAWADHSEPRLYIFSGSQYWRYDSNLQLLSGYPRRIASGFPGLPNNVDAAFVWGRTGNTFIFKGDSYYRLVSSGRNTRGNVANGYPRSLRIWNIEDGLNTDRKVDAVFVYSNARTYFFSGDQYFRFDDRNIGVDTVRVFEPPYPRNTKLFWLRCSGDSYNEIQEMNADPSMVFEIIEQADDKDGVVGAASGVTYSYLLLSVSIAVRYWIHCQA